MLFLDLDQIAYWRFNLSLLMRIGKDMKLEYLSMVFSISERLANDADSGFK